MARSHPIRLAAASALGLLAASRAVPARLEDLPRTLAVHATGVADGPVERLSLRARLEERGPIAEDARARLVARRARALRELAALELAGLAVRSSGMRVAPAPGRREAGSGLAADEVLLADELVLEVAGLAELAPEALESTAARVIDAALAAGLELGPEPGAELPLLELAPADAEALEADATRSALVQARRRADAIASALGLRVRGVRSVSAGPAQAGEARLAPRASLSVALEVTFDVE